MSKKKIVMVTGAGGLLPPAQRIKELMEEAGYEVKVTEADDTITGFSASELAIDEYGSPSPD